MGAVFQSFSIYFQTLGKYFKAHAIFLLFGVLLGAGLSLLYAPFVFWLTRHPAPLLVSRDEAIPFFVIAAAGVIGAMLFEAIRSAGLASANILTGSALLLLITSANFDTLGPRGIVIVGLTLIGLMLVAHTLESLRKGGSIGFEQRWSGLGGGTDGMDISTPTVTLALAILAMAVAALLSMG